MLKPYYENQARPIEKGSFGSITLGWALLFIGLFFQNIYAVNRDSRPAFDYSKDILIAQFDGRPDADDIHSQAALGSMLLHPDFNNLDFFVVMGAYGKQTQTEIWDSRLMLTRIFGLEGGGLWTDAIRQGGLERYNISLDRVISKVTTILQNGGHVWVPEAGQSDFTADWVRKLISQNNGINESIIKNQVHVVQHSTWNEDNTTGADLTYVKAKTDYIKISDGNGSGNGTPGYKDTNQTFLSDAVSSGNPNLGSSEIWKMADALIGTWTSSYSVISNGGVDFSDVSETWWILDLGSQAGTVASFWSRYVTNGNSSNLEQETETFHIEDNGVVVMDIESDQPNSYWNESTSLNGYLGNSYFVGKVNTFDNGGLGVMEYPIIMNNTGVYQLQWRSRITVGTDKTEHNDSFVRLVDQNGYFINPEENQNVKIGDWYKAYMNTISSWEWDTSNRDHEPKSLSWKMEAGKKYRLQVSVRSNGHAIDRIVLWNRANEFTSYAGINSGKNCNKQALDALPLSATIQIGDSSSLPPTVTYSQPTSDLILHVGQSVVIEGDVQDVNGNETISQVVLDIYTGGTLLESRIDTTFPYSFTLDNLASGGFNLDLYAVDEEGLTSQVVRRNVTVRNESAGNTVRVESEDFSAMYGVQLVSTIDIDSNINVGYIEEGDWLDYAISPTDGGLYRFAFRVASKDRDISFDLMNGEEILATISTPTTGGWQTWKTVESDIQLPAGLSVLRIQAVGASGVYLWNMNWFEYQIMMTQNQPPTVSYLSPASDLSVVAGTSIDIQADAHDPNGNGSIESVMMNIYLDGELQQYASDNQTPYSFTLNNLAEGLTEIDLYAVDQEGMVSEIVRRTITVTDENPPSDIQYPYGGSPWTIPGEINLGLYDIGGEGVAYHDTTVQNRSLSGFRNEESVDCFNGGIGWTAQGEWTEYTIDVVKDGLFDIKTLVASSKPGKTLRIELDGVNITGSLFVPETSDSSLSNSSYVVKNSVPLKSGSHVLRVYFETGSTTLYGLSLTLSEQQPYTGTPALITEVIKAPEFDFGGEGVSYHDTTTENVSNSGYRTNEGVDATPSVVGWAKSGEWVEYTVNVNESGAYNMKIMAATKYDSRKLRTELDGESLTGAVDIINTGSFNIMAENSVYDLNLEEGIHVLRVYFETDSINLKQIVFSK